MREAVGWLVGVLLVFIVRNALFFGMAVALVVIGAWAFEFEFSIRYAIALWSALCVLYALIRAAIPNKFELKGDETDEGTDDYGND